MDTCIVRYSGTAPAADTGTYALFSTATAFPGKAFCPINGYKRVVCGIRHAATGTVNLYKSADRGVNWVLADSFSASSTTEEDVYDALIEHMDDFKLEWVNGGSAQTTWVVSIAITPDRSPSV